LRPSELDPDGSGQATFTTSTLQFGHAFHHRQLQRRYHQCAEHLLNQVVNQAATSTTLISSANPSTLGQTVTFLNGHRPPRLFASRDAWAVKFFEYIEYRPEICSSHCQWQGCPAVHS
jgi:hypothetical protein